MFPKLPELFHKRTVSAAVASGERPPRIEGNRSALDAFVNDRERYRANAALRHTLRLQRDGAKIIMACARSNVVLWALKNACPTSPSWMMRWNITVELAGTSTSDTNIYLSDTMYTIAQQNLVYCSSTNPLAVGLTGGIEMGDEKSTPASSNNSVVNNFVMGCDRNYYWWGSNQSGGLVNALIANNTFVNAWTNFGVEVADGPHQGSRFENNIVVQDNTVPVAYAAANPGITFSHNLWSKSPLLAAAGPGDVVGDALLARTGLTGAGQLDPTWFKTLTGSPAHGKALLTPEVTTDFFGTARLTSPDIGGYQY